MSTDNIKDKVRALLDRANHPNTPQPEAESAIQLAYKLMQKYGLNERDIVPSFDGGSTEIVVRSFHVEGLYRVQRCNLLSAITRRHSVYGYRDDEFEDACTFVMHGREADIFAALTIYAAADLLGQRLLPRGSRSARTAWWQGFISGIREALGKARKEFEQETPGAGLVLADRDERAREHLSRTGPRLVTNYSYVNDGAGTYSQGKAAGRSFGSPGGNFGSGIRGAIG